MTDVSQRIHSLFSRTNPAPADWLSLLIEEQLDILPMPGEGATLSRWRALAAVGEFDLSLTKLYEGHTDALAILEEIEHGGTAISAGSWCVWAAEAPGGRTVIQSDVEDGVVLSGAKFWCSGAASADHALLTAWAADGAGPQLVAIALNQPGVVIDFGRWKAVGMASSLSVNVTFNNVIGRRVGKQGDYLSRPGFWQGGAGIAACWYGGAVGVATALRRALLSSSNDPTGYKLSALGRVELALAETAAVLRQSAKWIDEHPTLDASRVALLARLSAERCAKVVIDEVGMALGATPFCLDEKFARAVADLPVFIRQSHADRDFAALAERSLKQEVALWTL